MHSSVVSRAAVLGALLCLRGAPAWAQGDPASRLTLPLVTHKLANGLTVILDEDHHVPVVTVLTAYDVGYKADPPGRAGFAHLFEHLLFARTKHVPTVALTLDDRSALFKNAFTSDDGNAYVETMPSNQLDVALWVESERMAFGDVTQASFDTQRDVIVNEFRERYETQPLRCVRRYVREALYPAGHPYHRFGSDPKELRDAKLPEALAFYRAHYAPNDAALVVVGDFDPARAMTSIERYFGSLPLRPVAAPTVSSPVTVGRQETIDLVADVERPHVELVWPAPAEFHPGAADLEIASRVLGGTYEAVLPRRIERELGLADAVRVSFDENALASELSISATVRPGHTVDEVVLAIDAVLSSFEATAVPAEEIARARGPFLRDLVQPLESSLARAGQIASMWRNTGKPNLLPAIYEDAVAVTPESLRAAVARYMPPDRRLVVRVAPQKGAPVCGAPRLATVPAVKGAGAP